MPQGFYLAVTIFLGLCLGSFASALSWRLPRGVSVSVERSRCTSCRRVLGFADLVPLFSWLALRGRCRSCGAKIGWRYPLIELATLAICLAFYLRFGFSASTMLLFCLAPVVVAAADIDFGFKILPDSLNLSVLLLGLATLVANAFDASSPPDFIIDHGMRALGGAILYSVVALLLRQLVMAVKKQDPLGWGDVKFFAAAGFWLGLDPAAFSYFLMVAGFLGVAIALAWRKWRGEPEFPFGPALLGAFIVMLLAHPPEFIFQ